MKDLQIDILELQKRIQNIILIHSIVNEKNSFITLNYTCQSMEPDSRVQFNDSWFVFQDSSWGFHEPYFSGKDEFLKSYRVNQIQGYSFKTCK